MIWPKRRARRGRRRTSAPRPRARARPAAGTGWRCRRRRPSPRGRSPASTRSRRPRSSSSGWPGGWIVQVFRSSAPVRGVEEVHRALERVAVGLVAELGRAAGDADHQRCRRRPPGCRRRRSRAACRSSGVAQATLPVRLVERDDVRADAADRSLRRSRVDVPPCRGDRRRSTLPCGERRRRC